MARVSLPLNRLLTTVHQCVTVTNWIAKPFDAIVADEVNKLVEGHEQEGRTIEFKRELLEPKDSPPKDFLADVSSFASAIGGEILYGVIENDGRAEAVPGTAVVNPRRRCFAGQHHS